MNPPGGKQGGSSRSGVTVPGVTMLELFFDLVFVFLITQITDLITASHHWTSYARGGLVLVLTWWMYDGYAWLANNVAPVTVGRRLPMLVAMVGFLVMAVAVPDAFGDAAWVFAFGYFLVVTIHAAQFWRHSGGARPIGRILPISYTVVALLFLAAFLGPARGWIAWAAAVLVLLIWLLARRPSAFEVRIGHFAERHALLVIIALGETVISTGSTAAGDVHRPPVLVAVALAMCVISALWWVYFTSSDDEQVREHIEHAAPEARTKLAFWAYSIDHFLHISGLVLIAVGLHDVVHDPAHTATPGAAIALAAGTALFLLAQAIFRSHAPGT